MEININFSKNLRELRLSHNMKQKELAALLFVHQTSITDWEKRGVEPSYTILCKLAVIFDVTVGELLGVED